ncbi:FecCD family ABC transporter permease [Bacillus kexueae]|uniref:FecCD family ABC transporter permease n=1 Tax=Aeribacillus kexueae TaxID=2078952 RepID=UPI001FAEA574|nr:iron ABC transporter permease [Bacillus kexueae]
MIHSQLIKKQRMILFTSIFLVIATAIISLGIGYSSVSYDRIIPTILGNGTFKEEFVLFSIRLPRIFITILCGMALALSGAILQGVTRNDLADPGIIGINAGAGVGITIFFLFFPIDAGSFVYMLPFIGFIGALLTAFSIYVFSYEKGKGIQPIRLVLVGVGFSMALSGAMIVLISSAERQKVDFIAKWLTGNIWGADWPFVLALLPWLIFLVPISFMKAQPLNLLSVNEPVSIGVGVNLQKERMILLLVAVGLAASSVSISGGISFIGLMAPHLAKSLVGPRHQLNLPITIFIGGWLLLLADTIGRNILEPDGLPAGIVAALFGAPYFIYLLIKKA